MRVLILAHDYPPLNTIGGRRPYSWFRYFPEHDIHPVVVTKSWEDASSTAIDIVSQKGASETTIEEMNGSTLIRVPLRKNYPERLLATYGDTRYVTRRRALSLLYLLLSFPLKSFDKNHSIYQAAAAYLEKNRVDWIIATGEPFILFKYAHLLSKKFRVPWIADYRDGWYLNHNRAQQSGIVFLLQWQWEFLFEKKYLHSASLITSVDPLLTSKLGALHNKPAHTFYNGFEELSPLKPDSTKPGLPLNLCYSGTLYPGHQAELFLQAIKELHESGSITPDELRIYFIGLEFYPEQHQRVMGYSGSLALYVETTKRLPRDQAKKLMNDSDFLIVFSDRWTPVLPSKMYESVASRRPVLIVPGDHSILDDMVNELQAGAIIYSIQELKDFILAKITDKKNHKPLFDMKLDVEKAMKYSRENQAKEFAELLKQLRGKLNQ